MTSAIHSQPLSSAASTGLSLQSVIITGELIRRAARQPDHAAVNTALVALAQTMANSPERILQHLVETALTLCQAHSAGISLLEEEDGGQIFRWHGVAGRYSPHIWGTTPRAFSPCGAVLDTDTVQLMSRLDRHFGYFAQVEPRIEEALLIPFHVGGKAVGTIWVIAHDESRRFDLEDSRVIGTLAEFTAAAYQVARSQHDLLRVNEDLKRSEAALKLANNGLEQFALAASHDLQEPLRTVTAFTELLRRRIQGNLDAPTDKLLNTIAAGAFRMKSLIDDLLEYSRSGQDGAEPFKQTSLHDALIDTLANLQNIIQEHHASITYDPLPIASADKAQMTLLLQNLIVNAIKYRRRGESPRIHLSAERDEGHWIISVRDNGEGFSKEYSEKIFGVLTRLHGGEIPGTGIGLALCRKIVQRHGGTIHASSTPGKGSLFSFTLPVSGPA